MSVTLLRGGGLAPAFVFCRGHPGCAGTQLLDRSGTTSLWKTWMWTPPTLAIPAPKISDRKKNKARGIPWPSSS